MVALDYVDEKEKKKIYFFVCMIGVFMFLYFRTLELYSNLNLIRVKMIF